MKKIALILFHIFFFPLKKREKNTRKIQDLNTYEQVTGQPDQTDPGKGVFS